MPAKCFARFWLLEYALLLSQIDTDMGEILQDGNLGQNVGFFLKVEPLCGQTKKDSLAWCDVNYNFYDDEESQNKADWYNVFAVIFTIKLARLCDTKK